MLNLSDGINDMGPAKWDLVLSLLLAWFIAFFCMIKGIKSSGKVGLDPSVLIVYLVSLNSSVTKDLRRSI